MQAMKATAANQKARSLSIPRVLSLDKTQMLIEDRQVNLSFGMAVTVEIKTRSRHIIEYLLSPLFRHRQQAMREM
jgi:hemolysin D